MTPAHTETPLRRSEVAVLRDSGGADISILYNDDEAERREARRRTLLQASGNESSTIEESETLKKCLEIYNGNKLSRDNAWSVSLIDTLSTLLDRHHKSLNNFKVAGSSLEASSKVYSLRVDSVHMDVLRMTAGLNAQKFSERNFDQDDDDASVATGGDGAVDPSDSAKTAEDGLAQKAKKQKRPRKAVSTVTKNKDTLNARLDTVPLQDPVFGKLNSTVGSINSSNRLMNNILLTNQSELMLRTNFRFWDPEQLDTCDFTEAVEFGENEELAACDRLFKMQQLEELELRPLHTGYIISDTPDVIADDKDVDNLCNAAANIDVESVGFPGDCGSSGDYLGNHEVSMAFDMNAECEPVPQLNEQTPIVDVDYGDFDDLTTEERTAINRCRGLRKQPVLIEDLRPVDASSQLEYSYRPLDKISQFWAGPSHWKFKRVRTRASMLSQQIQNNADRPVLQRGKRGSNMLAKKRFKQINFGEYHDDLFIKLDRHYKGRKANIQKKWDQRKLKLPTDLQLDSQIFFTYKYAPGISTDLQDIYEPLIAHDIGMDDERNRHSTTDDAHFDEHFANADSEDANNFMTLTDFPAAAENMNNSMGNLDGEFGDDMVNKTVLEIATSFEGAPTQVTKIIVPFAKRAKVIDMKNLKRNCAQLINKKIQRPFTENEIPKHKIHVNEQYVGGAAGFREIYHELPSYLSTSMAESLSPAIALYSVLHLANDLKLRLIPQDDHKDFKIRQIKD